MPVPTLVSPQRTPYVCAYICRGKTSFALFRRSGDVLLIALVITDLTRLLIFLED